MSFIATKPAKAGLLEVERAFRSCAGQWKGCDWFTSFGKTHLNLRAVRASHALLMARATAGEEKADWLAAVEWLTEVEQHANEAEYEARESLRHVRAVRNADALDHARLACEIEEQYHPCPVWILLKEAVEAVHDETERS